MLPNGDPNQSSSGIPPFAPNIHQSRVARYLDALNRAKGFFPGKPSDLYKGALALIRPEAHVSNVDWMSQAAHSLREITYGFNGKGGTRKNEIQAALQSYSRETKATEEAAAKLHDLHEVFVKIAHHFRDGSLADAAKKTEQLLKKRPGSLADFSEEVFRELIACLEEALIVSAPAQLSIHEMVDEIVRAGPAGADPHRVGLLANFNVDAKRYFFSQIDGTWFGWLRENGLLDVLGRDANDPNRYEYTAPELFYLAEAAKTDPAGVTKIVLSVDDAGRINPDVANRLMAITADLPKEHLPPIALPIRDRGWVMATTTRDGQWGFHYEKILGKLRESNDSGVLAVVDAMLSVRPAGEEVAGNRGPFYLTDLAQKKIFEALVDVDDGRAEEALAIAAKAMERLTLLGERSPEGSPFELDDDYRLFDVDFFTLELGQKDPLSDRDDVRELAAAIKILAGRVIGGRCDDAAAAAGAYRRYIEPLPSSYTMWRLRLYVLSLCPEVFRAEIRSALFSVFDHPDHLGDIVSGAEYERLVASALGTLSAEDRREYLSGIARVFGVGTKKLAGRDILSAARALLSPEELETAERVFGPLALDYEPQPSIGPTRSGSVAPRPPGGEDERSGPVASILVRLRDEWSPAALKARGGDDDFFSPTNAEGAADWIRGDVAKRPAEYLDTAQGFFDRDRLDPAYTHALLSGLYQLLREDKPRDDIDFAPALDLLAAIAASGKTQPFEEAERQGRGSWLADWGAVHDAAADLLHQLIGSDAKSPLGDFTLIREKVLGILGYLLSSADPSVADEEPRDSWGKQTQSDPFTTAINSTRGRAFKALVAFVYRDRSQFGKDADAKISKEVKDLYKELVGRERTCAIAFMFGHYLHTFYYGDRDWLLGLMPSIFPVALGERNRFLAAWEGYLSNNLYQEMFREPAVAALYELHLGLSAEDYADRPYFHDLDEGLASHLALAYIHHADFGLDHPLLQKFWSASSSKRHGEFVNFVGQSYVTGGNAEKDQFVRDNPLVVKKIEKLWDWLLERGLDPEVYAEFGFWVNPEKKLFEESWLAAHIRRTLEKSVGAINWEYGLVRSIESIARCSPEDALAIARLYLLEWGLRSGKGRGMFIYEDEWTNALKVLCANPAIRESAKSLIDELIDEGGNTFWPLKAALK